jgi:hypothetical protein
MSTSAWFGIPSVGGLVCVKRAQIPWALRRFAGDVVGPFADADAALAGLDDRACVCSRCSGGRGRHVCAECQAAILPAVLCASVATAKGAA